ncbi:hypothetical protein EDB89DRAFT_919971 [Lactarius sanguifluus]|nr:hypothetical protein EDB89DRAFT_919971 [Lactarius sanguifluus]
MWCGLCSRWWLISLGHNSYLFIVVGSCVVIAAPADAVQSLRVSSKGRGFRAGIRKRNKERSARVRSVRISKGQCECERMKARASEDEIETRSSSEITEFRDSHAEKEGGNRALCIQQGLGGFKYRQNCSYKRASKK